MWVKGAMNMMNQLLGTHEPVEFKGLITPANSYTHPLASPAIIV